MKTIFIIGIGGRTGALFGRELKGAAKIVGVGLLAEVERIKSGKIKIERGGRQPEIFSVEAVLAPDFLAAAKNDSPDFVWLAVTNPVKKIVEFYCQNFAGWDKFPALVLSQNGLSAIEDARAGLAAALGYRAAEVKIIRVSLLNGVDLKNETGDSVVNYKLPIKLGFGSTEDNNLLGFKQILAGGGIRAQEFNGQKVLAMENSKLFLNLIGMAAAVEGKSADQGWRDQEIFKKEIAALKEFVLAAKKTRGGFVNDFCGYPVKFLADLTLLPVRLLSPFRGFLAGIVAKGRNRPKNLAEIDWYNGEVVRLGKAAGMVTPVNEEIVNKAKIISDKF